MIESNDYPLIPLEPFEVTEPSRDLPSLYSKLGCLVPSISFIALGALTNSNFRKGFGFGILNVVCLKSSFIFYKAVESINGKTKTENKVNGIFTDAITSEDKVVLSTLVMPIGEELVFRGILQPLISRSISLFIPIGVNFLACGLPITVVKIASIAITSLIFGYLHEHPSQKISATISGVAYGILYEKYGLLSSIASHVCVNTFLIATAIVLTHISESATKSEAQGIKTT
jgi:membrane protease YdiL (CAAX protease family)